jgi:hypothetical protein
MIHVLIKVGKSSPFSYSRVDSYWPSVLALQFQFADIQGDAGVRGSRCGGRRS